MAKPLVLSFGETEIPLAMVKIDRAKLYGWRDNIALDDDGRQCELATLIGDGRTIVAKGGRSIAQLTPDGEWVAKGQLTAIDPEGKGITPVGSSFAAPIELSKKATIEEYLSHNVKSIYLLQPEDGSFDEELLEELKGGAIYSFPFSWRGGLVADNAFLLCGADGNVFLAIGQPTKIHFVGLEQAAGLVEEDAPDEAGDDEDLDFGMM
jgi:hypothetical protein